MMYEPNLSTEMSEDASVCGTDFLRSCLHHPNNQPHHPSKSTASVAATTTTSTDKNSEKMVVVAPIQEAPQPTPLLASVSSTALDTEKKRRGNVAVRPTPVPTLAYGPLVLTWCNSEPIRLSVRLMPDACFWKDRHHPIGAAGIGILS